MKPRIELLKSKKLIGNSVSMSIINNKTRQLWGQFAPRIIEVKHRVSDD